MNRIKCDKETKRWFDKHPFDNTTVVQCGKCGLYFKPILGHRCAEETTGDDFPNCSLSGCEAASNDCHLTCPYGKKEKNNE